MILIGIAKPLTALFRVTIQYIPFGYEFTDMVSTIPNEPVHRYVPPVCQLVVLWVRGFSLSRGFWLGTMVNMTYNTTS